MANYGCGDRGVRTASRGYRGQCQERQTQQMALKVDRSGHPAADGESSRRATEQTSLNLLCTRMHRRARKCLTGNSVHTSVSHKWLLMGHSHEASP